MAIEKFPIPVEVFETPHAVDDTDPEGAVYRFTGTGIIRRSGGRDRVVDRDGSSEAYLTRVYHANPEVEAKLNAISASYHAMKIAMQDQWDEALAQAERLTVLALDVEVR